MVVAFRRHTLLPLDDCLYALQPSIPHLTRSAFSALFKFGGALHTMPAQGNMGGAIENAAQFAQAVYQRLTGEE